jgi:hypothetical protein
MNLYTFLQHKWRYKHRANKAVIVNNYFFTETEINLKAENKNHLLFEIKIEFKNNFKSSIKKLYFTPTERNINYEYKLNTFHAHLTRKSLIIIIIFFNSAKAQTQL